jgi:hypothetical protein
VTESTKSDFPTSKIAELISPRPADIWRIRFNRGLAAALLKQ